MAKPAVEYLKNGQGAKVFRETINSFMNTAENDIDACETNITTLKTKTQTLETQINNMSQSITTIQNTVNNTQSKIKVYKNVNLAVSNWSGNKLSVPITGMNANKVVAFGLIGTSSTDEIMQYAQALIVANTTNGNITFTYAGNKPTRNLYVDIIDYGEL